MHAPSHAPEAVELHVMAGHEHPLEGEAARMHGCFGSCSWELPERVTTFDVAARDYCCDRIMAHEYLDSPEVLRKKVTLL
eukprot:327121-Prymnesium_polylepis.1